MFISLLLAIEIFRETSGTYCHDVGIQSKFQVATFCQSSQATGNAVILDGYAAYNVDTGTTCSCEAFVTIPNSPTTRLDLSAFFGLHPRYAGCGSSITVQNSDENVRMSCTIAGSIEVNNNDTVRLRLKKDTSPKDTRYCMKVQMSDQSASVSVTCYGNESTITTTTRKTTSFTSALNVLSTSTGSPSFTSPHTESDESTTISSSSKTYLTSITEKTPVSTTVVMTSETNTASLLTKVVSSTSSSSTFPAEGEDEIDLYSTTTNVVIATNKAHSTTPLNATQSAQSNNTFTTTDTPTTTSLQMTSTDIDVTEEATDVKTIKQSKTTTNTLFPSRTSVIVPSDSRTPESTVQTTTKQQVTTKKERTTTEPMSVTSDVVDSKLNISTSTSQSPTNLGRIITETTKDNDRYSKADQITKTSSAKLGVTSTVPSSTTMQYGVMSTVTSLSSMQSEVSSTEQSSSSTVSETPVSPNIEKSNSDEIPVEIIAPVASVCGLLIICLIICIVVGVRRNWCDCTDDTLPLSNKLVDKVSVDIKNREKDTYVNPLYDDISLTGKSDRSDVESMMQEIPSDDEEHFPTPDTTKIDGELWTHL